MTDIEKIIDAVREAVSYYQHSVEKLSDIHAIGVIFEQAGKKLQKYTNSEFKKDFG